ncbi:MAG TPA: hypothetical protein ENK02_04110 [Planctomycetes bacterium]|nr:hypothetical protein [Planctomycetota bacterium]
MMILPWLLLGISLGSIPWLHQEGGGQSRPTQKAPPKIQKPKEAPTRLRPSQVPAILRFSRMGEHPLRSRIRLLIKAIHSSMYPHFPNKARLLLQTQLGMLYLAGREPSKALQTFETALKSIEGGMIDLLGRSLLGKGQALVALGRRTEALGVLRSVETRCPGTIYAKQAKQTSLIYKSLSRQKESILVPRLPLHFQNLSGKGVRPHGEQLVLLLRDSPADFMESESGERLAKKLKKKHLLILAFAENPRNLDKTLRARMRVLKKQTGLNILFLPPQLQKALKRFFPLQIPRSILFSLDGRFLESDPSPHRLAAFLSALK